VEWLVCLPRAVVDLLRTLRSDIFFFLLVCYGRGQQ